MINKNLEKKISNSLSFISRASFFFGIGLMMAVMILLSGCNNEPPERGVCRIYSDCNSCELDILNYLNDSEELTGYSYFPEGSIHTCCWRKKSYNESEGFYYEDFCRGFEGTGDIPCLEKPNITYNECSDLLVGINDYSMWASSIVWGGYD